MKVGIFYHSLVSDWKNTSSHFMRGIVTELINSDYDVTVYEQCSSWKLRELKKNKGEKPIQDFKKHFRDVEVRYYEQDSLNLDAILYEKDIVIVHSEVEYDLINKLAAHRTVNPHYSLFFYCNTETREQLKDFRNIRLENFDTVLCSDHEVSSWMQGYHRNLQVWKEGIDVRRFFPVSSDKEYDMIWVGHYNEGRKQKLLENFLEVSTTHNLNSVIYGAGYPEQVKEQIEDHNVHFGGWIPNFQLPYLLGKAKVAVNLADPDKPAFSMFMLEAMACGVPVVSTTLLDEREGIVEGLDYIFADGSEKMGDCVNDLIKDKAKALFLSRNAMRSVNRYHTSRHRARQLLDLAEKLRNEKKHQGLGLSGNG